MMGGEHDFAVVAARIAPGGSTMRKPNSPEYVLRLRSVIAMAWLWYQRVPRVWA